MSRFYRKFGHITIAGDLIGSQMPRQNIKASSVIMEYWPGRAIELITLITPECDLWSCAVLCKQ